MIYDYNNRVIHFELLFNEFYAPQTTNVRRHEIESELETLKLDPQVYQICFHIIKMSSNQVLVIYAINVIEAVSKHQGPNIQTEAYNSLLNLLLEYYDRFALIINKKLINLLCLVCFRQNPDQIQFSLDRIISLCHNECSILTLRIILVLLSEVFSGTYPISTALCQSFHTYMRRQAQNIYSIVLTCLEQVKDFNSTGRAIRVSSLRPQDFTSSDFLHSNTLPMNQHSISAHTSRSASPHNQDLCSIVAEKVTLSLRIFSQMLEKFPEFYIYKKEVVDYLMECARLVFKRFTPFRDQRLSWSVSDMIEISNFSLTVLSFHLKLPEGICNSRTIADIFSKFITDVLVTTCSDVNILDILDQTYCDNFCQLVSVFLTYVLVRIRKLDGFYIDAILSTLMRVMNMPINSLFTVSLNDVMSEIIVNISDFDVTGSHLNPERIAAMILEFIPRYNCLYYWNHNYTNLKERFDNNTEMYEETIASFIRFSSAVYALSPHNFVSTYISMYDNSLNNMLNLLVDTTPTSLNTGLNRSLNMDNIILSFKDVSISFKLLSEMISTSFIYKENEYFEFARCKEIVDRALNFMNQFAKNPIIITAVQNLNVYNEWIILIKDYFLFLFVLINSFTVLETALQRSAELAIYDNNDITFIRFWVYDAKLNLCETIIAAYFDYNRFPTILDTANTLFTTTLSKFCNEVTIMAPNFQQLCQYIQTGRANEISVSAEACLLSTVVYNLLCLSSSRKPIATTAREILDATITKYKEKFCEILIFLKTSPFQQLDQFSSKFYIQFMNTLTQLSVLSMDSTLAQKQYIAEYFSGSIIKAYEIVTCTILPKEPLLYLLEFYCVSLKAFKKQLGINLIRNFIGCTVAYAKNLPNCSNSTTLDQESFNEKVLEILLEITEQGILVNSLSIDILKMIVDHIAPNVNQNSNQTTIHYVAQILGTVLKLNFTNLIKQQEADYAIFSMNILIKLLEFANFESKRFIISTFAELNRVNNIFTKFDKELHQSKSSFLLCCVNFLLDSYYSTIHEDILKSLYGMVINNINMFFNDIYNHSVANNGRLTDHCKILLKNILLQTPNDSEYYFSKIMTEFFHDCSVLASS